MTKGISYYKDRIAMVVSIISILFALIVWNNGRIQRALIDDQVRRNTEDIEKAELNVLVYKMEQIEKKVDAIYELVK